jgi:hypothetical protein
MLPDDILFALNSYPCIGFSGSRSVTPAILSSVLSVVSTPVYVGCASGVDCVVRSSVPSARVFRATGSSRGAFAARSIAFTRAVAAANGVLFSFPGRGCPVALKPCANPFRGFGSGSWATLSLAIALEIPCFIWLPKSVSAPSGWGLEAVGDGWFSSTPKGSQLSLF